MQAGKLQHEITLEREVETIAASGAVAKSWQPIATVKAERVQLTATEFLVAAGEATQTAAIWRIRYLPGLTLADRVRHGEESYDLKEIVEIGRRRGLELRGTRVQ